SLADLCQGSLAIACAANLIFMLQHPHQVLAHISVVIDYQHIGAAFVWSGWISGFKRSRTGIDSGEQPARRIERTVRQPSQGLFDKRRSAAATSCQCVRPTDPVCRKMIFATRNGNNEGCAFADKAFHPNGSPVQFYQFLHEGKSDSTSLMCAAAGAFDSMETVEHPCQFFPRNAHTGVSNLKFRVSSDSLKDDRDASFKGKL